MSNYYEDQEPKISAEGAIGTTVVHLLLLLLMLFFGMNAALKEPEEQGILINFGTSDEGMGDVQPVSEETASNFTEATSEEASAAEKPKTQLPNPVIENEAQTSPDEQAPALPVDDRKKNNQKEEVKDTKTKETPKDDNKPKSDKAQENKPQNTTPKPAVDPNALFPGTNSNNASGQGNQNNANEDMGKVMGKVDISDNQGNESPGMGDAGVGVSLSGRRLLDIPSIQDNSQETGVVVVRIKVDRTGKVIDAQFQSGGSTTTSSTLRNKAIAAAKQARFNETLSGVEIQSGTLTFRFKVR